MPYDPDVGSEPNLSEGKYVKKHFLMTEEKPKWHNESTSSSVGPAKAKRIDELYKTSDNGQNFTERVYPATTKNLNGGTSNKFFTRDKRSSWLTQNAVHNHRQSWNGSDSNNNVQQSTKRRGKITSALGNILEQLECDLGSLIKPDQENANSGIHHTNN